MKFGSCKALFAVFLLLGGICRGTMPAPMPGHEKLPVIFWAHYMPMVPRGHLHGNHHIGGNADVFPFLSQDGNSVKTLKEDMREALAGGINGFQFLTSVPDAAFQAAAEVKRENGKHFYIAPEWCALPAEMEASARRIADFIKKYKDNPFLARIDDRQVHFLYGFPKWIGKGPNSSEPLPEARRRIRELCGESPLLIPTINLATALLDRPDLCYKAFPAFESVRPGPLKFIRETDWDGATDLNGSANIRPENIAQILERAASRPGFLVVPALRTMYDSSNRSFQAIHCRGQGIRLLRNGLRQWVGAGCRFFTFSTWNDVNETMLLPSSRNVWGYNLLIRYYHEIAKTGASPFRKPEFIVSYEPEVLLGDQGFFQCLLLPGRGVVNGDYAVNVEFRNLEGRCVLRGGFLLQSSDSHTDDLGEFRYESLDLPPETSVLQPYVSIREIDSNSGASRMIFDSLRLAPIRIRVNKLHYYTPYAVALSRIENVPGLRLSADKRGGESAPFSVGETIGLRCTVPLPFDRVTLAESCLHEGAFRPEDSGTDSDRWYLRFQASGTDVSASVTMKNAKLLDRYVNDWNLARAVQSFSGAVSADLRIPGGAMPLTLRVEGGKNAVVILRFPDASSRELSLKELSGKGVTIPVKTAGKTVFVRVNLTLDATDPNLMYPIKPGTYTRMIPLNEGHEGERVFHAWAISKQRKISYTPPFLLRDRNRGKLRRIQTIASRGVFDDFVDDSSSLARNPFRKKDLVERLVPDCRIPYFRIDFEEGGGNTAGFRGSAHQLGFGFIGPDARWVPEEKALIPGKSGIRLRAKTWPHGSFTAVVEFKLDPARKAEQTLLLDGDNWQGKNIQAVFLGLDKQNHLIARRKLSGGAAEVRTDEPLKTGQWHRAVLRFDQNTLSLFVDGRKAGEAALPAPALARTHSVPRLGTPFYGRIRLLEVTGAALEETEIKSYTNRRNAE